MKNSNIGRNPSIWDGGVSIILCTNRSEFADTIFANYKRQIWGKKELILILNNDKMNLLHYQKKANKYKQVSVYKLPQRTSLGRCLNYAISKSKYAILTKFDDDDYYAPYYLSGIMNAFQENKADVIGKRTSYMYLEREKMLRILNPDHEHTYAPYIMGGTISFRRRVTQKVKFQNVSIAEDVRFYRDCKAKGIKMYSIDRYNYVYKRRANQFGHTWKVSDRNLKKLSRFVRYTPSYERFVNRIVR
jgi:cellulose synthase/poly-beta-1,6-N-acetylglucosamine synthase-like glycosyltransferase